MAAGQDRRVVGNPADPEVDDAARRNRAAVADTSIDDQQVAAVPNLDASNDVLGLSETDFVEAR